MISVCIITYNHEKYILEALKSVLAQKDVVMEVIIGDDSSTDNTFTIISEFIQTHKLEWKILPRERNVGMSKNWQRCIEAATGDYIALLEADDYWNDEKKLAKQIQLLEADGKASACFTNASVINEIDSRYYPAYVTTDITVLTSSDLVKENNIPTCTVVFRNNPLVFHLSFHESPYVDWLLHLMNAQLGHFLFLNEKTSTYRLHEQGAYGGASALAREMKMLKTMQCAAVIFRDSHKSELRKLVKHQHEKIAYKKLALGDRLGFLSHKLKSKLA
jgi:glycosyltransferase involved in cell wall biosynthesis